MSGVPSDQPIAIPLQFSGAPKWPLVLRIHRAVITFAVDINDAMHHVNGTVAGLLDTEEFVAAAHAHAGRNTPNLCGTAFDGIADQLRQAQDMLHDGTNTASLPCDAISIGIGFTARLVANPTKVAADAPFLPDPCAVVEAGSQYRL